MKKSLVLVIGLAVIAIIILVGLFLFQIGTKVVEPENIVENNNTSSVEIKSNDDIKAFIDKIYDEIGRENMMKVESNEIDLKDNDAIYSYVGLSNSENIEYAVVSEPMMTSSAYSFVVMKLKSGVNSKEVAQEVLDNVNPRKWICVEAEQTNVIYNDDIICLVMTNTDLANKVKNSVKSKLNIEDSNILEKINIEDIELPPEILVTE